MIRKFFCTLLLIGLTSCATLTPTDPVLVKKIDAYFNAAKSDTYQASEKYKRPIAYAVGQYIVTGMTHASERTVEKMALVGKQGNGWIIEMQSLAPRTESITQMLVRGMEAAQASGDIEGLDIYRRCAKNLILGISTICLWLNFSGALISTKFSYFWMGTR